MIFLFFSLAGSAVDDFIKQLLPFLEKGDIIIDGGNSEYQDTQRRCDELKAKGLLFIGTGVSGGEEGARFGPSLMPGGHIEAWLVLFLNSLPVIFVVLSASSSIFNYVNFLINNLLVIFFLHFSSLYTHKRPHVKDIFQSISAKVGSEPCCDWVGDNGAGHFVKMVHNGIEYGDMQLICEAYHLMKDGLGLSCDEMGKVLDEWNKGELDSFLIEITAEIMKYKDTDGKPLVDKIRDSAGQKGTGKWTAISALEYGVPVTLIGESVFARCLSSLKDERVKASSVLKGPSETHYKGDKKQFIEHIRKVMN